jgi:seryl-tRNA synthetase
MEMHDLSFFRNNFERVAERLASRGPIPSLDRFRELDRARRAAISQSEQLKAAANAESAEIGKLRRQGEDTTARQERTAGRHPEHPSRIRTCGPGFRR